MKKSISLFLAVSSVSVMLLLFFSSYKSVAQDSYGSKSSEALKQLISEVAAPLHTNSKQITFVGPRSGEGYFNQDGSKMIFQSEREPGNPFYQMYILDLISGKTTRVSTGQGQTTCGWIHPTEPKVMWSSTHLDKKTAEKVKVEYEKRANPVKGRYSWSFDDEFDIFESSLTGKNLKRLTKEKGYDAEGSYSPDGKWIAFASNRSAFTDSFKDDEKKLLERDSSYAMEIYIMKADGSEVKRLTQSPGYDGGPFFSADGKKITWRRFTPDGSKAEIFTMNVDGSEQKAITQLGSMSWAPFFHPSGDYIIFASSVLGYANFELFIVDSAGTQKPVRVTTADGFDGLATFSPDGHKLSWSHRNEKGESQIYLADWNDSEARKALKLPPTASLSELTLGKPFTIDNVKKSIEYLASEKLQGRATGTEQEKIYTQKIAELFKTWGLKPALGSQFIQPFEFVSGVQATEKNSLEFKGRFAKKLKRSEDYQVLSYSKSGVFQAAPVAFAGYGIKAAATDKLAAFDSYKDLDVKGKWVVVLEGQPRSENKDLHHHLLTFSRPQHKATVAKNLGALGLIFVSETPVKVLKFEGSLSDVSLPVLKITDNVLTELLKTSDQKSQFASAQVLRNQFETLKHQQGFIINSQYLSAEVDLHLERSIGHNVIGKLETIGTGSRQALLVGAHGDHLGRGVAGNSLAKGDEKDLVHYGADDNASGVAGVLELAHYYSRPENLSRLKKPLYFAVWSGEEIGVLGSNSFVKHWEKQKKSFPQTFEASLNMDMIGRLRETLQVSGVGSAKEWSGLSEEVGLITGQNLSLGTDPYLPTDSMTFYIAKIPSISFFTGAHSEYHTPRDTAATINYPGILKVIEVVKTYMEKIATVKAPLLKYAHVEGNSGRTLDGRSFRIFLGTIPDYAQEGVKGVRISGASKNSPADKAGLVPNDIIVEFDGTKIENLYDYVYTLQSAKPGVVTKIKVNRSGQTLDLAITPVLKE